jgi:hypothetical protein
MVEQKRAAPGRAAGREPRQKRRRTDEGNSSSIKKKNSRPRPSVGGGGSTRDLNALSCFGARVGEKGATGSACSLCVGARFAPTDGGGAFKRAAMAAMVGRSGATLRFSQVSGIQQLRNVVALFVNVENSVVRAAGAAVGLPRYDNQFFRYRELRSHVTPETRMICEAERDKALHKDDVCVTWFAQASQTPASPALVRIFGEGACTAATMSSGAAASTLAVPREPTLLWIRPDGASAYMFAGRLAPVAVDFQLRPIRAIFRLCDSALLETKRNSETSVDSEDRSAHGTPHLLGAGDESCLTRDSEREICAHPSPDVSRSWFRDWVALAPRRE